MSASLAVSSAADGRPFLFPSADIEPLLKKLSATSALARVTPASRLEVRPAPEMVSSGIPPLDALTGGLPGGCLTEIYGPASSGRTGILLSALARATQRGEVCALVDTSDALHPASAVAAGVEMKRLLWVRCGTAFASGRPSVVVRSLGTENRQLGTDKRMWERRLEQVLKVTDLLLQSNGFGIIVLDLGDVPTCSARRIPLASWFRFRRAIEHTPTVLLVLEQQPIAGSCSSVVVKVAGCKSQVAERQHTAFSNQQSVNRPTHTELFNGFEITAELVRSRLSPNGDVGCLGHATPGHAAPERKPPQSATATFCSRAAWG